MTVERYQPREADVVNGEVVDEQPRQAGPVRVLRATAEVVRHERTRRAGWRGVEAAVTTVQGLGSWGWRAWDAGTLGVYRRQIRAAEAAGDAEALADWVQRRELAVERRHKRLLDMPRTAAGLARVVLGSLAALVVLVLLCGLVVQLTGEGTFTGIVLGFLGFLRWAATAVVALWTPLVAVAPFAILAAAYREGQRRAEPPRWVARHVGDDERAGGHVVTADGIVQALQHLGITAITRALKDGWVPRFDLSPVRDGSGFRTVFELPMGVTPDAVSDRRAVLARNLHRAEVEVWPSDAVKSSGRAGCVELWVADPGSLSHPAPEHPLLHEGGADVFAGVPIGVTLRGDPVAFPLVEANFVVGGQPGQGKSNLCRVVMLGAALDPLAELWVHVFAGNGDFDAYTPRLAVYRRGADRTVVESGVQSLRQLYGEVSRREQRLAELGAKKVTRQLAAKHPDLRPLVSLYSECHEMFGSDDLGDEAADYAAQTVKRGRKAGVILGFDTQSSRKDAIPPKLVELVKLNACFAVKSWRSNDGFLGDGSFAAGIRATELRPGKDRGTCLVTGIGDEAFEIVKTHYLDADDDTGWDQATDVIARAAAEHRPVEHPAFNERDLLGDVRRVLGGEAERATQVAARLRDRGWALNGTELVERLHRDHDIPPRKLKGYAVIRPEDLAGVDDDEAEQNPL